MSSKSKIEESNKIMTVFKGLRDFIQGIGILIEGFTTSQGTDEFVQASEIPPKSASIKKLEDETQTVNISLKDEKEINSIKLSKKELKPINISNKKTNEEKSMEAKDGKERED